MSIVKEFCAENITLVERAIQSGANRIELCDNLAVGGTSVSYGVLKEAIRIGKRHDVPIMAMIRPRGGNFVYTKQEQEMMLEDIRLAVSLGIEGIVIGALTDENWIDEAAMELFLKEAQQVETVFHMAFDAIPKERQFEAIDWIVQHGMTRILTHGGEAGKPIEEHADWINQLIQHAQNKCTIMPGGKVTTSNLHWLVENIQTTEFHGTRIVF